MGWISSTPSAPRPVRSGARSAGAGRRDVAPQQAHREHAPPTPWPPRPPSDGPVAARTTSQGRRAPLGTAGPCTRFRPSRVSPLVLHWSDQGSSWAGAGCRRCIARAGRRAAPRAP
jgi:hypothetical protein